MVNALPAGLGLLVTGVWQRGDGVVGGAAAPAGGVVIADAAEFEDCC